MKFINQVTMTTGAERTEEGAATLWIFDIDHKGVQRMPSSGTMPSDNQTRCLE
jgi:hypothetical protein